MKEYALLIDNTFREIRVYDEKPVDIPHKKVTWHDIVRETGETAFNGLVDNVWIIRTVNEDINPPVPYEITSRQVRLFLLQQNLLADVEAIIQNESQEVKIQWEYSTSFQRNNPLLIDLATRLNISSEDLDQFFIQASKI